MAWTAQRAEGTYRPVLTAKRTASAHARSGAALAWDAGSHAAVLAACGNVLCDRCGRAG